MTHASRGDEPGAPAPPRHGASSETVTVAPGIAALYAVPMFLAGSRAGCLRDRGLDDLLDRGDGQQFPRVVIEHLG
jgi:hypothetical protein